MSVTAVILLGVALAADAFAVSVVCGTKSHCSGSVTAAAAASAFALFQMLMPVLGWSIGKTGSRFLGIYQNTAAFVILVFLGIKMIADSRDKFRQPEKRCITPKLLLLMAVATSIDALAAGIALPSTAGIENYAQLLCAAGIIGGITFILSIIGYISGKGLSRIEPASAQIIGGIVLIALGIKSLF